MNRLVTVLIAVFFSILPLSAANPPGGDWEFLSTATIGAKVFREAHPDWDGRGVLIAVCDTGVDLNLRGLLETPDGKPKILDARVFSTEGKITLEKAVFSKDERGEAIHGKGGRWLYGLASLPGIPAEAGNILVGYFEEEMFKNSDMADLNGNGTTSDSFGMVAFEAGEGTPRRWVAFVDTDGDGDLAGEPEVRDFAETRQAFSLRGRDSHSKAEASRFALNLWPAEKEAALYMDDGSHGTHVAGIAAGYRIDGQEGYDGIAPGAQVLGLKLGNSTLAGGATTSGSMVNAWKYAVKKAAELKMPLVIQMSFGTGSENLGGSAAEKLLEEILEENPGVVATLSAGNEGPGLSTVGMPSRMRHAFAVGALLAKSTAADLYGAQLDQDEMFSFSSRGGESGKPDFVCPGFAASTVPAFDRGKNIMRGTSMAAPQAAGACALLLSAATASGLPVRRDFLAAALKRSAKPLPGYGPYDIGAGLVSVPAAWEVYRELARGDGAEPVLFEAETESPDHRAGKGPSVYWRGLFPSGEAVDLSLQPIWPADASADFKAKYYRAFNFECPAPWLRLLTGSNYIKAGEPAKVKLSFDGSKMKAPGLYQTSIDGFAKGGARGSGRGPDLRVPVAVAVPYDLGATGEAVASVRDLRPAKLHRIFFRVPAEAGAVSLALSIADGERGAVAASLFDPEGRTIWGASLKPEKRKIHKVLSGADLEAGTYELTLYANYMNTSPADVGVRARALPLARPLPASAPIKLKMGKPPEATLRLATALNRPLRGKAEASLMGCVQQKVEKLTSDTYSRSFSVLPGEVSVRFDFSLSPEDYGLFTDIAVLVVDKEGVALAKDGLTYRKGFLEFEPPGGAGPEAIYTLKIVAAAADPDTKPRWNLTVAESHIYGGPVKATVTQGKGDAVTLYPDREASLNISLDGIPPALPAGAAWLLQGEIRDAKDETLRLPFEVRLIPAEE